MKCEDGKYFFSIISVRKSRIRTGGETRLQGTGLYCLCQTTFLLAEAIISVVIRLGHSKCKHLLFGNTHGSLFLGTWDLSNCSSLAFKDGNQTSILG